MPLPKRRQLLVDPQVQGMLMRHACCYCLGCILFVTVPLLIGLTVVFPQRTFVENLTALWTQYQAVLMALVLMVPFILYDLLKLSNRFAGPLFRLRREMRRLADGEDVQPIHFRDGDFWQDMAFRFNQILARIHAAEKQATQNAGRAPEPAQTDAVLA